MGCVTILDFYRWYESIATRFCTRAAGALLLVRAHPLVNPLKIKSGQLITCKEGYYLGTFSNVPFSEFVTPYTPWLSITSFDLTARYLTSKTLSGNSAKEAPGWVYGFGEVIIYIGKRSSQLTLPLTLPHETVDDISNETRVRNIVQHHEVLWRGTVYRVRSNSFRKLKTITSSSNK